MATDLQPSRDKLDAVFAALDLGTNNCRLLVARPARQGFEVLDSFSRIVRLGEGLAGGNRLSGPAIERTMQALRVCRQIMRRQKVARARCVATEACRRAENGPEFVGEVERALGLRLEVLGHEEEARLALLGCLPLVDPDAQQVLMIDIGGGSTEIVLIERDQLTLDGTPSVAFSLPIGVVTLAEQFGSEPDAAGYRAMIAHVTRALWPIEARQRLASRLARGSVQVIGTSGTVTTIAAIHLGLRRYDRRKVDGTVMPFAAAQASALRLRAMDDRARAAHPCIGPGRADLVVAGCAIVEAIHEVWPIERVTVADRGVREGILTMLMAGRAVGAGFDG